MRSTSVSPQTGEGTITSPVTIRVLSHLSFLSECRSSADIAFLLDGSGSVSAEDFLKMKDFVKNLVSSFVGKDTKVGQCHTL